MLACLLPLPTRTVRRPRPVQYSVARQPVPGPEQVRVLVQASQPALPRQSETVIGIGFGIGSGRAPAPVPVLRAQESALVPELVWRPESLPLRCHSSR